MGEIFIALAKASIAIALGLGSDFDLAKARQDYLILNQNRAVFITLRDSDERLRGCIGSLVAHRPLYKDIIINAKLSALSDSRFAPLTPKEFESIKIEVSLLSTPKEIKYNSIEDLKAKITPQKDGVILKLRGHRATYLPSVWEQLPKFDEFFISLCQKAGLKENCLEKHPSIKIYQSTKYREK